MGSFDDLIEKKLIIDDKDKNADAELLAKDSVTKVLLTLLTL